MVYKAVLFSRISTEMQSMEAQTAELWQEIKRNGYAEEETYVIEYTESAIHNRTVEERRGLQMLQDVIEHNPIELVVCREVSRIARVEVLLYQMRDYLREKRVQMICTYPYFKMFESDWQVSATTSIVFALVTSMASTEMQIKKARFRQSKELHRAEGKWVGGKPIFGYSNGAGNRLQRNAAAHIVERIFTEYAEGKSCAVIAEGLYNESIINHVNSVCRRLWVNRVLSNKKYLGDHQYPRIISDKLWEQVHARKEVFKKSSRHTGKSKDLLAKGIFHTHNGYLYSSAMASEMRYISRMDSCSLRIELCEDFVWDITQKHIQDRRVQHDARSIIEKQIQRIERNLYAIHKQEREQRQTLERLEERYIKGRVSSEMVERITKEVNRELIRLDIQKKTLENEKYDATHKMSQVADINLNDVSVADKQHLVRTTVKSITTHPIKRYYYTFNVVFCDGSEAVYNVNTRSKTWEIA